MIRLLYSLIGKVPPPRKEKAREPSTATLRAKRKELVEAKLALLSAQTGVEYATAMVNYQETRIARLTSLIELEVEYLEKQTEVDASAPAAVEPTPKTPVVPLSVRLHPFKNPEVLARKTPHDYPLHGRPSY